MKNQTWSRSHSEEIRRELGPFPASAASNACAVVKRIIALLPEGWKSETEDDLSVRKPVKEFGHNISFNYLEFKKPVCVTESKAERSGYDSLSDDEEMPSVAQKSELISGMFNGSVDPVSQPPSRQTVSAASESGGKYSGEWLKSQCQSCCKGNGGLQWGELYSAVFDLLSSPEENSGIENNVCV